MIKFEKINKKYKDVEIIKELSFTINDGEIVALVGKSGCGKTTTLKMINKLIQPTKGSIYVDGKNICDMNDIALRRNMGYVIQHTGIFPHMTVKENIEIIAKLEKVDKDVMESRTKELLSMVGLDESYIDRYPVQLSGGQQQRVGVARAFEFNPDIILMDEPFSALDPLTRIQLQDELLEMQRKFKKTIVFVTHDMSEAIKIADRICIMDKGQIVQYDTPENILKYPKNNFVQEFVGKKRIWSSPEYIKAKDIMTNPITCYSEVPLIKALDKMRLAKIDCLPVIEWKTNQMLGIVMADQIRNVENMNIPVSAIMNKDYKQVFPDDSIIDIFAIVDECRYSILPVVDENNVLCGALTHSSLITTLSQQYKDEEVS